MKLWGAALMALMACGPRQTMAELRQLPTCTANDWLAQPAGLHDRSLPSLDLRLSTGDLGLRARLRQDRQRVTRTHAIALIDQHPRYTRR